eukprot:CAMPEP_0196661166 /NCGR_PEP_ID=MMETSP1086-20130531/43037_1 /TAXON_ID=77921 /ORGANISM="Cyanoptyche  gloeocystis , Strain SAG4.97" /LENGTH=84 /DNA_ID=CAMNT_0041995939 /DNA_START=202 /DNA_END=460 /DNA_ORIENTATION=+
MTSLLVPSTALLRKSDRQPIGRGVEDLEAVGSTGDELVGQGIQHALVIHERPKHKPEVVRIHLDLLESEWPNGLETDALDETLE